MKKLTVLASSLTMVAALAFPSLAADDAKAPATETPKELHNQTNCPVMGGAIDSTAFTDIQGQRVYHCCPMCSAKLKADPDKYFQKAAEEGVLFENIQTTCPVSGHELAEKTIYTDYEGRRIYFCSENHRAEFSKDPTMYLKKMDQSDAQSSEKTSDEPAQHDMSNMSGNMDHNH
jgi:YHS domain-containing protein